MGPCAPFCSRIQRRNWKVLTSCPAPGDSLSQLFPLRLPSQVRSPLGGVLRAGAALKPELQHSLFKASRVEQACLRFRLQPWGFGSLGVSSSRVQGNLGCRKEWALASRGQRVEVEGQGQARSGCFRRRPSQTSTLGPSACS